MNFFRNATLRVRWKDVERIDSTITWTGTVEGAPLGNATLLFAHESYEQVIEAYVAGLEQCAARGGDLTRVASVASFFVSRIDTAIDTLVSERPPAAPFPASPAC